MRAQDEDVPIRVDVTVVNVLCTVRNGKGLVRDLEKDKFQLFEDGHPATIKYFARQADLPLRVVLLLDVSGSMSRFIETEKETAHKFLEQVMKPQDAASIFSFGSTVVEWQGFSDSHDQLKRSLSNVKDISGPPFFPQSRRFGSTLLHDAVYASAQKMENKQGAKTIVLISDGLDSGSYITLGSAIRAAQVAVHTICYEEPKAPKSGCSVLKKISESTGGRFFKIRKSVTVDKVFAEIREEIRNSYLIGFAPSAAEKFGFHKLEVQTRPRMSVNARKGYFIPRPRTKLQAAAPMKVTAQ